LKSQIANRESNIEKAFGFFLIGPTAVGKTSVAHILATRRNLPLISADSMLVYRHMNIGTAKPSSAEIARFQYAGLDLCDPDRDFNVADYLRAINGDTGFQPASRSIACGGSGLYVRCLTEGLRELPPANEILRARAEQLLATGGVAALQTELKRRSPEKFASLTDPLNPRRLIRALELDDATISSDWKTNPEAQPVLVGLRMEKSALEKRIRLRVEKMYADGLIEEARGLRTNFERLSKTALQAIGYSEAFEVLDGKFSEQEAKEFTAIRTRQLAKKQMTWFRRQHRVAWIDVAENDSPENIADAVEALWNEHGPAPLHS
jgi:tRNA dimethylallyltransferase